MIHLGNNLYIARLNAKGDIRLVQFKKAQAQVPNVAHLFDKAELKSDLLIDSTTWPEVMASVAKQDSSPSRVIMYDHLHQNCSQPLTEQEVKEQADALEGLIKLCQARGQPPADEPVRSTGEGLVWMDEAAEVAHVRV